MQILHFTLSSRQKLLHGVAIPGPTSNVSQDVASTEDDFFDDLDWNEPESASIVTSASNVTETESQRHPSQRQSCSLPHTSSVVDQVEICYCHCSYL